MKAYLLTCISFVLFLLVTSCEEKVIDPGFGLGREFGMEVNKLYTSEDGQYSVIINEVTDSRCAEAAQCLWQGEVTIKGEWTANGNKAPFEIHSVLAQMNKQPEGYLIQIVDARPYPVLESDRKPEELIIGLLVKKN